MPINDTRLDSRQFVNSKTSAYPFAFNRDVNKLFSRCLGFEKGMVDKNVDAWLDERE